MTALRIPGSGILLAALFIAGGCQRINPGDASFVSGLRVLGIKGQPPDVAPGSTTTLSALAVDGQNRQVSVSWSYCTEAMQMGQDIPDDCVLADGGSFITPIGNGPSAMMTMPTVDQSVLGDPDRSGGVYLPVRVTATAGSDTAIGIYQLRYNTGATPNQNPTIAGVYSVMLNAGTPSDGGMPPDGGSSDGGTFSNGGDLLTPLDPNNPTVVHSGDKLILRALFQTGSVESYMVAGRPNDSGMASMRPANETLSTNWFSTGGTVGFSMSGIEMGPVQMGGMGGMGMGGMGGFQRRIPDVTLTMDQNLPPSGTLIDVWVVATDNRGGADWQHRVLMFQ